MTVRELFDALNTKSYADWAKAITELRHRSYLELQIDISELNLLLLLRAHMWWRHNPGFVDVYATCEAAMPVILAHIGEFGDKGRKVGSFLATYLDTGKHDRRGDEIETHLWANDWAAMLQGAEAEAMRALSTLMHDIYLHKHEAYHVLIFVGWQHPTTLGSLIHGLPPDDQTFILHALDGSLSKPGVRTFYDDFIANTPYPHLVKAARRYAGMLDESSE